MPDSAWKQAERRIAALLGGYRVWHAQRPPAAPLDGFWPGRPEWRAPHFLREHESRKRHLAAARPNVVAGDWRLQIRLRAALPRWLTDALEEARLTCQQPGPKGERRGRPALVVVRSAAGRATERYAVLPFAEFKRLLAAAGELPDGASDGEDAPVPDIPPLPPPPRPEETAIYAAYRDVMRDLLVNEGWVRREELDAVVHFLERRVAGRRHRWRKGWRIQTRSRHLRTRTSRELSAALRRFRAIRGVSH